ncbi:Tyrosine-protein phosphatase [Metarhizium brunneum]|uniref:Tyrosine-protein phosphatase n=1 Tax=Metarhizium brunneum TaxID=500148 RepID=A0A7D5V2C9_9HYPO
MTDPKLLASLAAVPIEDPIDPDTLETVLSGPPFVILPGSLNIRDVGAYAPGYIKPGLVYRSGTLDFIPEAYRSLLRSQLGVSTVFDFRRGDEVKRRLCDIDGIQVISCPFQDGQVDNVDVDLAAFVPPDGEVVSKGYRDMYSVILEGYTTGYRKVFEALKSADRNHAVLFHCMGGKDRTGVMSALVLDLMRAPVPVIAEEYALTRVGTEPFRAKMLPAAILGFAGIALEDGDGGSTVQNGLKVPGVREILGSRAEIMADFMEGLETRYGGAEGYLRERLGFSEDDVRRIRDNLRP